MAPRPPWPRFTVESAIQKVRLAEDAWNSGDPERVSLAYTIDSGCRNRSDFVNGRSEFDEEGLMRVRHASIHDLAITENDRKLRWPRGKRPDEFPGLSALGL
jgi:nuclear transport factor 2 (NTF2) superfamily protein